MINALRSVSRVTQLPLPEHLAALFTEHKASHAHKKITCTMSHYRRRMHCFLAFTLYTISCNIRPRCLTITRNKMTQTIFMECIECFAKSEPFCSCRRLILKTTFDHGFKIASTHKQIAWWEIEK